MAAVRLRGIKLFTGGVALVCALLVSSAAGQGGRASVQFKPIATGLGGAIYVTHAPGQKNALYVVRQGGVVNVVVNGKLRAAPFLNLSGRISAGGEQGLLSLVFHPNYAKNRLFYVNFTDKAGDSRVVRYRSNGAKALTATAKQLLFVKQPYGNHNGGGMQFGPDGRLWAGFGDGGSGGDPHDYGQNLNTKLGKLIALNVNKTGAKWQTVGYGLRNPWRFSFDKQTGDLWVGDVGQNEWEEIDYVKAPVRGLYNFGWSVFEGRERFKSGQELKGSGRVITPVHVYGRDSGCSVTGGYVYRGTALPALQGRYLFGDFCTGKVWSGVGGGSDLTEVREEGRVGELSSFGQDAAGELYATSLSGTVFKLS